MYSMEKSKTSPLGKKVTYIETYAPDLLFPIARAEAREASRINPKLFQGYDIWNGYELSWLNPQGKPEIALLELQIAANSTHLVESKSLKLYLNSFNQTKFTSKEVVEQTLHHDLSQAVQGSISLKLFTTPKAEAFKEPPGSCLDLLDIETSTYSIDPRFLKTYPEQVEETLHSNLLKSNCLATGQPDWGTLIIHYHGPKIDHEGLLKYIISYRGHAGFHEHCVEQIYQHLYDYCKPKKLTVYARYTRRGGLDINPFRSNFEAQPSNERLIRQ